MAAALLLSAFFSASETAAFQIGPSDLRALAGERSASSAPSRGSSRTGAATLVTVLLAEPRHQPLLHEPRAGASRGRRRVGSGQRRACSSTRRSCSLLVAVRRGPARRRSRCSVRSASSSLTAVPLVLRREGPAAAEDRADGGLRLADAALRRAEGGGRRHAGRAPGGAEGRGRRRASSAWTSTSGSAPCSSSTRCT